MQRKNLDAQRRRAFQDKGKELAEDNLEYVSEQMEQFKQHLEHFARKRKGQIRKDPYFRYQFQLMCSKLGVDPLSSNKGFWAQLLGVGNFYTELGIQIIHICLASRERNGGLMSITQLCDKLKRIRGISDGKEIIQDDVEYAIKVRGCLVSCFTGLLDGTYDLRSGNCYAEPTTTRKRYQGDRNSKWQEDGYFCSFWYARNTLSFKTL